MCVCISLRGWRWTFVQKETLDTVGAFRNKWECPGSHDCDWGERRSKINFWKTKHSYVCQTKAHNLFNTYRLLCLNRPEEYKRKRLRCSLRKWKAEISSKRIKIWETDLSCRLYTGNVVLVRSLRVWLFLSHCLRLRDKAGCMCVYISRGLLFFRKAVTRVHPSTSADIRTGCMADIN